MFYRGGFFSRLIVHGSRLTVVILIFVVVYVALFGFYLPVISYEDILGKRTSVVSRAKEHTETKSGPDWVDFRADRIKTANLQNPSILFAPFIHWLWPGGDVAHTKLTVELEKFYQKGFGGVSIQASTAGINAATLKSREREINRFNSEDYYYRIASVLRKARSLKMRVDLHNSSSQSLGGDFIAIQDNQHHLNWSLDLINEAGEQAIDIGKPQNLPITYNALDAFNITLQGGVPKLQNEAAKLLSVIIAKQIPKNNAFLDFAKDTELVLDADSRREVIGYVREGVLRWDFRSDNWVVISTWLASSGAEVSSYPSALPALVVDSFDQMRLKGVFESLFGEATQLDEYQGKAFRGVVSGRQVFDSSRVTAHDLLAEFHKRKHYELNPWLPVLIPEHESLGKIHVEQSGVATGLSPEDINRRIKYDYQLTISDLFIERFVQTSTQWFGTRNLGNRNSIYGSDIDIIRAAGATSVPEVMLPVNGDTNSIVRLISSGAFLYNRAITSAQIGQISTQGYPATPLQMKLTIDNLLTSGINQFVFSGIPYPYKLETKQWQPLGSYGGEFHESVLYGETNPFWEYQEQINHYLTRMQYLMQSGREVVDVLIYFPFLGFSATDMETTGSVANFDGQANIDVGGEQAQKIWWQKIRPIISTLESYGLRFAWTNDHALQTAEFQNDRIRINGKDVLSILIVNTPYMQSETARRLATLDEKGASIQIFGESPPARQPGYYNHKKEDDQVKKSMYYIVANQPVLSSEVFRVWSKEVTTKQKVRYSKPIVGLKRITRETKKGRIHFFHNKTGNHLDLQLDSDIPTNKFLLYDAVKGFFYSLPSSGKHRVAPYEGIVALEQTGPLSNIKTQTRKVVDSRIRVKWVLSESNSVPVAEKDYSIKTLTFTADFDATALTKKQFPILELPFIQGVGTLVVNNKDCATILFSPFKYNLQKCVIKGQKNQVQINLKLIDSSFDSTEDVVVQATDTPLASSYDAAFMSRHSTISIVHKQ